MAAGTSSGGPVPTAKEEAPLLWTWLSNHTSAALHPTETDWVMILEQRNTHILQFQGVMWQ